MKKKHYFLPAFAAAIILSFSFCGTKNTEIVPGGEFSRSFAIELFRTTVAKSGGANLCISPYNINNGLNIMWNGASGETETELGDALGYGGYTKEQINRYAKTLAGALSKADPGCELKIANSVWANKNTPFNRSFVRTGKTWYNAEVRNVDFGEKKTLDKIDEWCRDNTGNKIDRISEGVSSDMKLVLMNAIYFKGEWEYPFSDSLTEDEIFTNSDGSEVIVPMMKMFEELQYSDDGSDWMMLKLPYGNGMFNMTLLMSLENEQSLDAKLETLTADKFYDLLNSTKNHKVKVRLPKFTAEYSYTLHEDILPAMGIRRVFDPSRADLGEMCKNSAYINTLMQKSYIIVNEEGTEAAEIVLADLALSEKLDPVIPIEFFADRPFVYSIVENGTGTILFIGRINNF